MTKSDFTVGAIVRFVFLIAACALGAAVAFLLTGLVGKLVVLDFVADAVIKSVLMFIFTSFFAGLFVFEEGYKTASFPGAGEFIGEVSAAATVHLVLSVIFSFVSGLSGPAFYTSGLVVLGEGFSKSSEIGEDIPKLVLIGIFVLYEVLFSVVMYFFGKLGKKKRLESREELINAAKKN